MFKLFDLDLIVKASVSVFVVVLSVLSLTSSVKCRKQSHKNQLATFLNKNP